MEIHLWVASEAVKTLVFSKSASKYKIGAKLAESYALHCSGRAAVQRDATAERLDAGNLKSQLLFPNKPLMLQNASIVSSVYQMQ